METSNAVIDIPVSPKSQLEIDNDAYELKKLNFEADGTKVYIKDCPEDLKPIIMNVQLLIWQRALDWERSNPQSLSSKRLAEFKKILE